VKHETLAVVATTLFLAIPAPAAAAADELGLAEGQLPLRHQPFVGYTEISPRAIDTILCFLRQASVLHPVTEVQNRLKDLIQAFDAGNVSIAVVPDAPDDHHPLSRVLVDANGKPRIEYFLVTWDQAIKELTYPAGRDRLIDRVVAATLHSWEHYRLHHQLAGHIGKEALARQEAEVWRSMMGVLATGRKEYRFALSERDDKQVYFALLCYAAAEKNLGHPAWRAFLSWLNSSTAAPGVELCQDMEKKKSARL
jgi:hypothetical protein